MRGDCDRCNGCRPKVGCHLIRIVNRVQLVHCTCIGYCKPSLYQAWVGWTPFAKGEVKGLRSATTG